MHEQDYTLYTGNFTAPLYLWKHNEKLLKMNYFNKKYKLFCICGAVLLKFRTGDDELYCDICNNVIPFKAPILSCTEGMLFYNISLSLN